MSKKQETVRVWHPDFKSWANPLKADLPLWEAQGWVVTPAEPETKEK
jgi:hypothetical protein